MSDVRHRVVAGQVHAIPDDACAYCHARPPSRRAPVFHCSDCDRHLGERRLHFLTRPAGPGSLVLCFRCAEARREQEGPFMAASRAAAANLLGLWP
jgi:hypothetical protein